MMLADLMMKMIVLMSVVMVVILPSVVMSRL